MKKIFALLPLIAAFGLAGCGEEKEGQNSDGTNLELTREQVKEKVNELATTEGYEISFTYTDDEEAQSLTIGQKDGYFWAFASATDKTLYKVNTDNSIQTYEYDEESGLFRKGELIPSEYGIDIATMTQGYGSYLYTANAFDGLEGFHKVKDLTFVGRSATEYKYSAAYAGNYVEARVIIDKETGVTLLWEVQGGAATGETGYGKYEVTSFKTGAQVSIPAIQAE